MLLILSLFVFQNEILNVFGHILNWKCFFFLGSDKGEALITVIANHMPRNKKQDVIEEKQFWTSLLQKRVKEKTLASVWVKDADKDADKDSQIPHDLTPSFHSVN